MCAGVAKPCRRPLAITNQVDDLVVEVSRASAHEVPVAPPPLPPRCLRPERSAEGERRAQCAVDSGIVPPVPQFAIEPLDQFGDMNGHSNIVGPGCPASPARPPSGALSCRS